MNRFLALLVFGLPLLASAGEYKTSLVVQTGELRESDLVVRNITDLNSRKTCLAFYVRTTGTSPVMSCYDVVEGFGASVNQVGHIKEGELVIRKLEDFKNNVTCLVAYVSTPGTSPSVDCFPSKGRFKENMAQSAHLREGDLDVRRIVDPGGKTCLVSYVSTKGTSPSVVCYDAPPDAGKGGLIQTSYLREGDLVVRKILDTASNKACLISYVSTEGTSSHLHCYDD
jgi:hypothetical protein